MTISGRGRNRGRVGNAIAIKRACPDGECCRTVKPRNPLRQSEKEDREKCRACRIALKRVIARGGKWKSEVVESKSGRSRWKRVGGSCPGVVSKASGDNDSSVDGR